VASDYHTRCYHEVPYLSIKIWKRFRLNDIAREVQTACQGNRQRQRFTKVQKQELGGEKERPTLPHNGEVGRPD